MDSFERIQQLRDGYESALDDADRAREQYHREIVKLHRSGMSLREIADGLNISHQRVHQIVSPHEDIKAPSKLKRGAVAGAIAAALLITGAFLQEAVHRPLPPAAIGPAPVALAKRCRVHRNGHSSSSPLGAAAQCGTHGRMVSSDTSTGQLLPINDAADSEL